MKKSLSVISSLLFAALCLGFAFNAYAQDVTALNDANTVISISEQNYVYDGTPKKPTVSVYYNGVLLSENVDYSLKFSDFVSAGTVKVTVTGMNSYNGSVTKEYTIKPITLTVKIYLSHLIKLRLYITTVLFILLCMFRLMVNYCCRMLIIRLLILKITHPAEQPLKSPV